MARPLTTGCFSTRDELESMVIKLRDIADLNLRLIAEICEVSVPTVISILQAPSKRALRAA